MAFSFLLSCGWSLLLSCCAQFCAQLVCPAGCHAYYWQQVTCPTACLSTRPLQLWWVRGIANANFFYGMNLAWAAWQVFFLLQLLKAAVRLEGSEGQGMEGKEGKEGREGKEGKEDACVGEESADKPEGGGMENSGVAEQQRQQNQKQQDGEDGVGRAVASGVLDGSAALETAAAAGGRSTAAS